jgi:acyl carrier protein
MPDLTSDLDSRLQAILRPKLRFLAADEPLPMDRDLGELGLDSMSSIDLLMDIENELGIQIPDTLITADTFSTGNHLLSVLTQAS